MEGSGFGGLFGDPDEIQRRLGEFAEQMQGAQRLAWADNAIKLAVDLTVAAMNRVNIQGTTEQQAEQLRAVMAVVFPEAVTLVREAREGLVLVRSRSHAHPGRTGRRWRAAILRRPRARLVLRQRDGAARW